MDFENSEISFDCVLPSAIFYNQNLEPAAIKCYAIIRNLTKIHGYCFASNEHLAGLLEVDISSVKRWISALEEEGFLELDTLKKGVLWERKIFISNKFNKCLRRLKNKPSKAQNCAFEGSKLSHIKEEGVIKGEEKEIKISNKPPSAIASALADFFLSKIKEKKPDFIPQSFGKWAHDFDLMLKDGRNPDLAKDMMCFVAKDLKKLIYVQSASKFRKDFDRIEMEMQVHRSKSVVNQNRDFALDMKVKYPEQLKNLKFDDKFVGNRQMGKEIAFDMNPEAFKEAFVSLFGGEYVRTT